MDAAVLTAEPLLFRFTLLTDPHAYLGYGHLHSLLLVPDGRRMDILVPAPGFTR